MAWIESHQDLANHPKTRRLMRTLQITRRDAIGMLHLLWWWAMEFASEGSLAGYSPEDLSDAVDWEGDAAALVDALTSAGFLEEVEGELQIHDWWDYAGKLLEKRKQDAERKRAARTSKTNPQDVHRMSNGRPADGARNRNHDRTVTNDDHAHAREAESTTPDSSAVVAELEFEPTPVANLEALWSSLKGKNPPFRPFDYEAMRECLAIAGGDLALVEAVVRKGYQAAKERRNAPSSFRYFPDLVRQEVERRGLVAAPVNVAPLTPPPTRAAPEPIQIVALRERIARQLADNGQFPDYPAALRTVNAWPVERLEEEQQKWTA